MVLELLIPCLGTGRGISKGESMKSDWDLQTLAGLVIPNPKLCVWVLHE